MPVARLRPVNPYQFRLWFDNVYLKGFRYIPRIKLSARLQQDRALLAVGANFFCQSVRQDAVVRLRNTLNRLRSGEQRILSPSQLFDAIQAPDILIRKAWRYYRHKRAYNPDDLGIDLRVHCEQAPNASSRLRLSEERDALGLYKSRLDWQLGELEPKTIVEFGAYAARQFELAGIARVEMYPENLQLESLICNVSDSSHHMGTARMAMSPRHGVVDENCKLFGIANGFVCSSAVFPTSGFATPTHTIVALGVRLAEHIARRHSAEISLSSQRHPATAGGAA